MLADPNGGRTDVVRPPQLELIAEVFNRAILDLFQFETSITEAEEYRARKETIEFFTNLGDEWAESREIICLALDLNPDNVRRMVLDVLEGRRDVQLSEYWTRASVEPSRAIWRELKQTRARDAALIEYARTKGLKARYRPQPKKVVRDTHTPLAPDWWKMPPAPDIDDYSEIEVDL